MRTFRRLPSHAQAGRALTSSLKTKLISYWRKCANAAAPWLGVLHCALWLLVPILGLPLAARLIDAKWYTPRTVACIELFYPLSFCIYALIVQRRFSKIFNRTLPKNPRLIFVSAAAGQASFDALLVLAAGLTFPQASLQIVFFSFTVIFASLILRRPSFGLLLIYFVFYLASLLWGITDFYLRIELDAVPFNFETAADYLLLPALFAISLATVLTLMLRSFRPVQPTGPLRYSVGLAVVLMIVVFGDFYYKVALFTRGDAFEYTKKAITLQSKRRLALLFPGLPSKLYDALIEDSLSSRISTMTFKDTKSGIELHVATSQDDTIGHTWGNFYQRKLQLEGVTHFRLIKYDGPTNLKTDDFYRLLLYKLTPPRSIEGEQEWHTILDIKPYDGALPFAQYIVEFPKSMVYHPSPSADDSRRALPDDTFHFFDYSDQSREILVHRISKTEVVPEIYGYYVLGIDSLSLYINRSHSYLDDSAAKVDEVTRTDYLDSFQDYLYFSMITMSTTGYGDIVAIHPIARSLTIAEIAIGWFLLLWLGSLLISGINKSGSERPEQSRATAAS